MTCDRLVTFYLPPVTDDDRVFRALADPTRRYLLDRLFARDGRTLTELESELEMTRFGVMKHLRLLEDAGLVVSRRQGREKLHSLNPVPIRLHPRPLDRQVHRAPRLCARGAQDGTGGHGMSTTTAQATQVYQVYIRATPDAIWDAITKPEFTQKYFHGATIEVTPEEQTLLRRDRSSRPSRRCSTSTRPGAQCTAGARTTTPSWRRRSRAVSPGRSKGQEGDYSLLTVTHDQLEGAPKTAENVSGTGWMWVLSGLKTLLETGEPLDR